MKRYVKATSYGVRNPMSQEDLDAIEQYLAANYPNVKVSFDPGTYIEDDGSRRHSLYLRYRGQRVPGCPLILDLDHPAEFNRKLERGIAKIDTLLSPSDPRANMFEVLEYLGWNGSNVKTTATGVMLKIGKDTLEDAEDAVRQFTEAADQLGVQIIKAKAGKSRISYGRGPYWPYTAEITVPYSA